MDRWLGTADAPSIGLYASGAVWLHGIKVMAANPALTFTNTTPEVMWAFDASAHLVWVRVGAGLWNNNAAADPATGIGGIDTGPLDGPLYAFGQTVKLKITP